MNPNEQNTGLLVSSDSNDPTDDGELTNRFHRLISTVDEHIVKVAQSQSLLEAELNELVARLNNIVIDEETTRRIHQAAERIELLRQRITMCHNILEESSTRCGVTLMLATSYRDKIDSSNEGSSSKLGHR